MILIRLLLPVLLAANILSAHGNASSKTIRVLFIGNSQMYTCDLPAMPQVLADSSPPDRARIQVGRGILGGRGLQGYWEAGEEKPAPRAMVAAGPWDIVVLQEAYNIEDSSFRKYATRFDELIRNHGATTLLFATASISALYPDGFTKLNETQRAWGRDHGVPCATAGYAWMACLGPAPDSETLLDFYQPDAKHPGPKGSYIYACLLYAHLTGSSPQGLTFNFPHLGGEIMTAEEAGHIQQTAWLQYQADLAALHQHEGASPPRKSQREEIL